MAEGLIVPALVLAMVGWLVPRCLSLVFPEGVRPLMILAFVATLVMLALGTGFFFLLYVLQGVPIGVLFDEGIVPAMAHFLRLGLISALLWGPIMVLSLSGLPKFWVTEKW